MSDFFIHINVYSDKVYEFQKKSNIYNLEAL